MTTPESVVLIHVANVSAEPYPGLSIRLSGVFSQVFLRKWTPVTEVPSNAIAPLWTPPSGCHHSLVAPVASTTPKWSLPVESATYWRGPAECRPKSKRHQATRPSAADRAVVPTPVNANRLLRP